MKKLIKLIVAAALIACGQSYVNAQSVSWQGQQWSILGTGSTAVVNGDGSLTLSTGVGSSEADLFVSALAPTGPGGSSSINDIGTPWIRLVYRDNGPASKGVDMFVDSGVPTTDPRIQAGSDFSFQGLGYARYGLGANLQEQVVFATGSGNRQAGDLHDLFVAEAPDGTIFYDFDGTAYSTSYFKDAGLAAMPFNDVTLRDRDSSPSSSATFVSISYGDDALSQPEVVSNPALIPEPSSCGLLLSVMGALGLYRPRMRG